MIVTKMSGAGNSFAVLDVRGQRLDLEALAKRLCKELPADGLLALDHSETADFRLHFYNSDGSRGEMCGNGARCICKFAYDRGLVGEHMTMQTDAGPVYGWRLGENSYRVQLNLPSVVNIPPHSATAYVELGQPGLPHSVSQLPELAFEKREEMRDWFLEMRHLKKYPKGVNVNFFVRLDEDRARLLTFERGVEDFTLACGTGSAAVAVVLFAKGQLPKGRLEVENMGGVLTVTVQEKDGQIDALFLEGPAETLEIIEK